MNKTVNTSGLLTANVVMHTISACMAGVWISELVSTSGGMTPLAWFETILAVIAISVGLTVCTYIALRHIPTLPPAQRRTAKIAFVTAYAVLAFILAIAAASVLAASAGEHAHMEHGATEMKSAIESRRRAAASIQNRVSALTDCEDTGRAMSTQEGATGAFSREGGDVGRVAITLANIASACSTARQAIYASRAQLARLFARADRVLIEMRRAIDSDMSRHEKLVAVRRYADEFQRIMRGVNDALAVEAMQSVSDAIRKDWHAAGLPPSAANAITQNFDGLADTLVEGIDDIAALKSQPLPSVPVVSNVAYLALYPDATMGALAIGAIIELIPLGGILLGMSIMEKGMNGNRAPAEPGDAPRKPRAPRARSTARRGRPPKA
ncbi:MAG: hypothetical protein IPG54_11300 [Sphingomonadales bacterium]|jgi:hypothetical protein|nr:hypothetical protein [Sphingomonadales bacterium]MBK9004282.1 hypothetical protein [Sphingomonadales bacterium]MBK9269459.1 hypothetical protein [Sphingomonadales bacterium]MBP6433916.1 hypothetical protein [Sphingorhabdus sp.]